jgi:hypothetical protein
MTERPQSQQWERRAHRRLTADAERAARAVRQFEYSAIVWADSVRQCTEDRMGIGPDDMRALDDARYCAALERVSEVRRLVVETERELEALRGFRSIEPGPPSTAIPSAEPGQEAAR